VRGTVVDDQYRIERVLGEGGMGTVYLARDLRLDREVALKLARDRSPAALARSTREALTLARLSHPNVVVIYQVGIYDQRLYVAMEYVKGVTARGWVGELREVSAILELYLAVGEGLAAAHAAGIVHHDFKPDNVLVGDDGRARVADFGLARTAVESEAGMRIAGTPAYMAPEQARGEAIDHRADQYAFCASLWEALHQAPVFASDGVATVSVAVAPPSEPGARSLPALGKAAVPIPRHVELALRRGLEPERDARWPSMAPLLAELRRDPGRKRRSIALIAGAAIVVAAGVAAVAWPAHRETHDPCRVGPDLVARVWSPVRRAATRTALAPVNAPVWLTRATQNALTGVDEWTARYAVQYRAVCEEAAWTPALRDRGFGCLAQAEHVLEGTLDNASERGFDAGRFEAAVSTLPRPESCVDPAYLEANVAPPTDPMLARRVDLADGELARTRQLGTAGQFARADELLRGLAGHAPDDAGLRVRMHYTQALLDRSRGDDDKAFPAMHDVYFEARAIGDRVTATSAARECALALLNLSRDPEAAEWAKLAEVESAAIPDIGLQIATLTVLATVANDRDQPAHGLELAERAVKLARGHGEAHLREALEARATAYDKLGQPDRALPDLEEATRIVIATSGEVHPELSAIATQRTLVLIHLGRADDAVAAARKAVQIADATAITDVMNTARSALGIALTHAHVYSEALGLLDGSLATDKRLDGDKSYNVASDLNNRCDLLLQMQRYPEAIDNGHQAIAIWNTILGPDANELGLAHFNVALAERSAGRARAARTEADAAVTIFEKRPANPDRPLALIVRGAAASDLRDWTGARKDLLAAIQALGELEGDPSRLAWAQLELARVDQATGDLADARVLATKAVDVFRASNDPHLDEGEALVAALGGR
jgi:tetratricopeptide (TPR) repeat protein